MLSGKGHYFGTGKALSSTFPYQRRSTRPSRRHTAISTSLEKNKAQLEGRSGLRASSGCQSNSERAGQEKPIGTGTRASQSRANAGGENKDEVKWRKKKKKKKTRCRLV